MNNLKYRLIKFLVKDAKGTFIFCGKCNSMYTKFYELNKTKIGDKKSLEYTVECLRCGSKGKVKEKW